MTGRPSLLAQLCVLVPTLAITWLLGMVGVPLLPRMLAGIGLGMILIVGVWLWQRARR